jgi:hypothetical protein
LDKLEENVCDGASDDALTASFKPYKHFAQDATQILSESATHIDAAVQDLQVQVYISVYSIICTQGNMFSGFSCQLEVMQYVGMGDGDPVSTVDFERMPVDLSMTSRMVAESRRELISATEKTLEQVWEQHKTLVIEHFFEEFERSKLHFSLFLVILLDEIYPWHRRIRRTRWRVKEIQCDSKISIKEDFQSLRGCPEKKCSCK